MPVDLAKYDFHVVGLDDRAHPMQRRRLTRTGLIRFLSQLAPCHVAMEACGGAHFLARTAEAMGHRAHVLPGQYVRAYTKPQKNDYADAEAIAEAATWPTMREGEPQGFPQQELQLLHRARSGWVTQRTETANRIRGSLLEFGIVVPRRLNTLRRQLPFLLEDTDNGLPEGVRGLLLQLLEQLHQLDDHIEQAACQLEARLHADSRGQWLLTVPGVGPVVASAMLAAIGDGRQFRRGRDLAAWLGLVPCQHSIGGRPRLLGIPKHGNTHLRALLIHGARAHSGPHPSAN
ncbi:IS110 family transposase [Thiohalorhabdus methylotrophus]|uniref:IS110 family transposase n=1 Tax=Thiohalorhabdus methylotrophus TaxID=3242694 RepID=A0ABV4U2A4_9GAMM